MGIETIPINSGTGPSVAVDAVGTDNYQIVKISTGADGTGGICSVFPVSLSGTGTVNVVGTNDVNVVNTVTVSGTASTIPTGTQDVSVVGSPTFLLPTATAMGNGRVVLTSGGDAIALGSGACRQIWITALATNTNAVMVGTSSVSPTDTGDGKPLQQLETMVIPIDSLGKIFINGANTGDGVTYAYIV